MASFRFHKSLPMACIYFFFNTFVFFPTGLMVTSILSPFFYFWLLRKKKRFVLEPFLLILALFTIASAFDSGIEWKYYVISSLLLLTIYATVYAFAVRLQEIQDLDRLVRTIIKLNFAEACVGLAIRFTPFYKILWGDQTGEGGNGMIRYRALTSEPQHYALLIMPLVLYSYWAFVKRKNWANFRLLMATAIPFLMSMSFGDTAAIALAILASQAVLHRHLRQTKWFVAAAVLGVIGFIALPSTSHLKTRVNKVLSGHDSSTNVRTKASYIAAYGIVKEKKDLWFGVGAGQAKLYVQAFDTWGGQSDPYLPCILAETLATFGIMGVALTFLIEGIFFYRGKPWKDPFRLSLFIVVFVLQFGSGYLNDPVEYFVWVIALSGSLDLFQMPVPIRRRRLAFRATPQPV